MVLLFILIPVLVVHKNISFLELLIKMPNILEECALALRGLLGMKTI